MKKTPKEKITGKLLKFGKKHKLLKIPIMTSILVISGFFSFLQTITSNTKKLISFACLMLFFFVGSSFASIGFVRTTDITAASFPEEQITEEAALSIADIEILEDQDVMEDLEHSEFAASNADYYTVDEILGGYHQNGRPGLDGTHTKQNASALTKDDWRLLLINKQHPIPEDYEFSLGVIKGSMQCDKRIIEDLLRMLQGAKADGINLVICSPYRDLSRQEMLFERKINAYMKQGMSYMEAYKVTSQAVTVPGASEHQIGLALDIVCDTYSALNEGFGETESGKWLAKHSCEYGFILRYPKGKEYITSIEYEPWHFRYVGEEAATQIMQNGLTLEEFVATL